MFFCGVLLFLKTKNVFKYNTCAYLRRLFSKITPLVGFINKTRQVKNIKYHVFNET